MRVPLLYGEAEKPEESAVNVLMNAVWKVQQNEVTVNMDHWALRYPTNTEDVGRVCQGMSPNDFLECYATCQHYFSFSNKICSNGDRYVADIAAKYLSTSDKASLPTTLQFSSEDKYTKYEICQLFAEIMGLSLENMKPNTDGNDPNSTAQRPYDCHLSTKALKEIGIPVHTQDFKGWWRRECRATRR